MGNLGAIYIEICDMCIYTYIYLYLYNIHIYIYIEGRQLGGFCMEVSW